MRKKRWYFLLWLTVVVGLIIYFVVSVTSFNQSKNDALIESSRTTTEVSREFISLFLSEMQSFVYPIETRRSSILGDISYMRYKREACIMICKLRNEFEHALDASITLNVGPTSRKKDVNYFIYENCGYEFNYISEQIHDFDSITLRVNGDSTRLLLESANVLGYYSFLSSASISFSKNSRDIYIVSDEDAFTMPKIPMSFLFLKRDKSLYLLVMTSSNGKLDPNLLPSLVVH